MKKEILPRFINLVLLATLGLLLGLILLPLQDTKAEAEPASPQDNTVLICHQPPPGPLWLWIDISALGAHLDHGDTEWYEGLLCGGIPYTPPDPDVVPRIFMPVMFPSCRLVGPGPLCTEELQHLAPYP